MGPIGNNLRPKTTGAPEKGSPTPAMPLPTSRRFQYPARHKPTPADQSLSSIPLPNQSPPARRPAPLADLCRFWSSRSVPLSVSPPPRKRSVHLSAPPARRSVHLSEHYPHGPAPPSVHRSAKVNRFQRPFPTPLPSPPRKRSVPLSAPPARRSVHLFEHSPNGPAPQSVHRSAKVNRFQRLFPTPPTVNTQEVCPFVGPVNTQEVCPSTRKRSVHLLPPSICCPPRKRSVHLSVPPPEGLSLCPNTPPKGQPNYPLIAQEVCPFVGPSRQKVCPFVRTLPQRARPTIRSSFRKGEPIPTTLSNSPDSQHSRGLSLCWPPRARGLSICCPPRRRSVPLSEHYPNGPAPPSVHRSAKVNQFQRSFPTPPTVNTQEVCPFVGPHSRGLSLCWPPQEVCPFVGPPPEGLSLCPNTPPKVCPFVRRRTCPFVRTLPQKASPTIRSSFRKGEPIPTTLSNSPDSQHSRGLSICRPPARRSVPLLVSQEVCPFVGLEGLSLCWFRRRSVPLSVFRL